MTWNDLICCHVNVGHLITKVPKQKLYRKLYDFKMKPATQTPLWNIVGKALLCLANCLLFDDYVTMETEQKKRNNMIN